MSITSAIRSTMERFGLYEPPLPENAFEVTGYRLLAEYREHGSTAWNGYRLIRAGGVILPRQDEKWPRVTSVDYLELGEDDEPTVYIQAEDDPDGSFPLQLCGTVMLGPAEES